MNDARTRRTRTLQSMIAAASCTLAAASVGVAHAQAPAGTDRPTATAKPPASTAAKAPEAGANVAKGPGIETSTAAATNGTGATSATNAPPSRRVTEEARACFQKAQAAYATGDLAGALAGFQCAYQAAPSPELHYNLARVYERMGEAEDSTRHYRAYLEQAETTPKEKKQIAARLQALQELRERQRPPLDFSKPTAEALGTEARAFYDRGVKLYRARQYQAALAAFSAALQMSNAPELHFNLGVVAERMNRPQEAIDHYRAYLTARSDAVDRERIEARIGELQVSAPAAARQR
jgi:tetratricopeptide (TPR) repeat protein